MKNDYKTRIIGTLIIMLLFSFPFFIIDLFGIDDNIQFAVLLVFLICLIYTTIQVTIHDDANVFDGFMIALVPFLFIVFLDIYVWLKIWTFFGLVGSFIGIGIGVKR